MACVFNSPSATYESTLLALQYHVRTYIHELVRLQAITYMTLGDLKDDINGARSLYKFIDDNHRNTKVIDATRDIAKRCGMGWAVSGTANSVSTNISNSIFEQRARNSRNLLATAVTGMRAVDQLMNLMPMLNQMRCASIRAISTRDPMEGFNQLYDLISAQDLWVEFSEALRETIPNVAKRVFHGDGEERAGTPTATFNQQGAQFNGPVSQGAPSTVYGIYAPNSTTPTASRVYSAQSMNIHSGGLVLDLDTSSPLDPYLLATLAPNSSDVKIFDNSISKGPIPSEQLGKQYLQVLCKQSSVASNKNALYKLITSTESQDQSADLREYGVMVGGEEAKAPPKEAVLKIGADAEVAPPKYTSTKVVIGGREIELMDDHGMPRWLLLARSISGNPGYEVCDIKKNPIYSYNTALALAKRLKQYSPESAFAVYYLRFDNNPKEAGKVREVSHTAIAREEVAAAPTLIVTEKSTTK